MEWTKMFPTQICLLALDIRFTKIIDRLFDLRKHDNRDPRLNTGKASKTKRKMNKDEKKREAEKLKAAAKTMRIELDEFLKKTIQNYQDLTKAIKQ